MAFHNMRQNPRSIQLFVAAYEEHSFTELSSVQSAAWAYDCKPTQSKPSEWIAAIHSLQAKKHPGRFQRKQFGADVCPFEQGLWT